MDKNEVTISIIIPIYNVGEYLHRCLSSVACQTFKDYEVIMVNDGSTDKSCEIAESFTKHFVNFRLVHNTQKGVSYARNLGVSLARGEYIAFVDSDDYIDPSYLLRLYSAAKEYDADVAHCNYVLYNIDSGFLHSVRVRKPRKGIMTNIGMVRRTISDFFMRSYLWNKLWKRSLFTDNNIIFPDMKFEDIATVSKLLYFANKGIIIDQYLYYYTIRDGSIVQTVSLQNISDYILSFGMLRRFFTDRNELTNVTFPFIRLAQTMVCVNIVNLFRFHFRRRNFKGYLRNVNAATRNILYFYTKRFKKASNQEVKLPYKFIEPEDRSKKRK